MFTVCVGLVLVSKYVQFRTIYSFQYSININTLEIDVLTNSPQDDIMKLKNMG